MKPQDAIKSGALALFGEKYSDEVRVVKMGDFSMELCGGTHVDSTSWIRALKIVSESGVSAGVRRIEAITGDLALEFLMKNTKENLQARSQAGISESWNQYLDEPSSDLVGCVLKMREEIKLLQKDLQRLKGNSIDLDSLTASAQTLMTKTGPVKMVLAQIESDDRQLLSDISDKIRDKLGSSLVILVGHGTNSHPIVVNVSKTLAGKSLHAGNILKGLAEQMGGKGGGRPDFAQGAAPNLSAFSKLHDWLTQQFN